MSFANEESFKNTINCYICNISFTYGIVKCKDHCHFSGDYLGAACQNCNLRRRRPKTLKIFVHNCSKYDMHFIIQAIPQFKQRIHNISVLPYNGENFRTLRFNCFEFLDSLAFLQASLFQLTNDLKNSSHEYNILKQTWLVKSNGLFDKVKFKMILSKAFFPYEYCTSFEKMKTTKRLPKIKKFFSKLSEKTISENDYKFAVNVWKIFGCKNLVDYTKLYCKADTILLAEVFETFRRKMMAFSGLDPAHYISLPAYSYDSMLLITNAHIELPTDINMVHFLEKGKRGGVSFINTRHLFKVNEEEEIVYQDRNNLYGEAQMQNLPVDSFRWLSKEEMISIEQSIIKNSIWTKDLDEEIGYFLECDLTYPSYLHNWHSEFPLAPEILQVTYKNLSPYVKMAIQKTVGKQNYKDIKLMSTFHDKKNYVLHGKNLQLYLSLGMKLKKVHRILEF